MAGYFIANFTIHDPEKFEQYWNRDSGYIGDFGGHMVVLQKNPTVLNGEPHQVIGVIEFESVKAAKAWHESPGYQTFVDLLVQSVDGWFIIADEIQGIDNLID